MKLFLFLFLIPLIGWTKSFMPSSFSANFEESFVSVATGKEKKSYGKIDYKYPGHIRFDKISPEPSTFVSNPDKSWYYVPPFISGEQGQVTIQKSNKLPLTKFLDSIRNGVEASSLFKPTYSGNNLELRFNTQMQKDTSLKEVVLHSSTEARKALSISDFDKLTLVYLDGRQVHLKFIDLKQDVSFSSNHFNFVVPAKTKVTNN